MNKCVLIILVASLAASLCLSVSAAEPTAGYPSRPVKFLIPYPPGASTDLIARLVANKLSEVLKQQVLVDNRGGAGGILATEAAARAPADGYTLLFGTSQGLVIAPLLNNKVPYDPVKDFEPVGLLVSNAQLLIVNSFLPVSSVRELLELARRMPGKINYASAGIGAPNHIGMEWLKSITGVDMVHVPFKGIAQAIPDMLENRVQVLFTTIPSVLSYLKNSKFKALAVTTPRRANALPDIPTMVEAGVPGFEYDLWYGIFAPTKTPSSIVTRLNGELVKMLASSEMTRSFAANGAEPSSSTPAELGLILRTDYERLGKVIRSAGIAAE